MPTATAAEIAEIRRHMAQIRREIHEDVQAVVTKAEEATDWKRYIRAYPWAFLGAACAVGYFVVPRKHRSIRKTAEKAAEHAVSKAQEAIVDARDVARGEAPPKAREKAKKRGLIAIGLGFLGPIVMRSAQSYALKYAEQWIAAQGDLGPLAALIQGGPRRNRPAGRARDRAGWARVPDQIVRAEDFEPRGAAGRHPIMVNRVQRGPEGLGLQADQLREQALDLAATARERFAAGREIASDFINEKPAIALGIAFGMGAVLGWLIKRR